MGKKKTIFNGMKGERIEVDISEEDAVNHHNKTIKVESRAWNKRNFSNDPTKVYNDMEIKEDYGEPLFPWLHDIFKKKKK